MGLAVSIDDVEHLKPGVVCYKGVRLRDPETGEIISTFQSIRVCRDVKDQSRPTLELFAHSARINPERFDSLPRLLHRVMARRMTRDDIDLRLVFIGKLDLQDGDGISGNDIEGKKTTSLRGVSCSLQTGHNGANVEFKFRLDSASNSAGSVAPVEIVIRRDRRTTPPSISFSINSGTTALPCDLLAMLIPQCKSLGPQSRLQGHLYAEQTADGWEGIIKGAKLHNIELSQLFGDRFPNTLTGQAQVTIQWAEFSAGRLQKATGSIDADRGTINRTFVESLWQELGIGHDLPAGGNNDLPYTKLAFDFNLDSNGLVINGSVPNQLQVPITVADAKGPLVGSPKEQPLPIAAWLAVLAPPTSPRMPVSEQTQWLSRHLPLSKEVTPVRR